MLSLNTQKLTIEGLLNKIASYKKDADFDVLKKAFMFANKYHMGQKRKTGEDYIIHPLSVAFILAEYKMDESTIQAALLHDVLENTKATKKDIEQRFGSQIAELVEGVTKLSEFDFGGGEFDDSKKSDSKRLKKAESLRKLFLAMAKDIRVVLIKLADRYHNLCTLEALKEEDQKRIARESLDIFAPLADRLGMGRLKADIEDLSFKFIEPEKYQNLLNQTEKIFKEKEDFLSQMKKSLTKTLVSEDMECQIEGRAKHIYSIYKKLKKEEDISKIYDLMAIRIIVSEVSDCYKALGVIHSLFKPLIYRIKDYIAVPKPNGYRSLHTTVFGIDGKITEIQIRTEKMHEEAEKGVAAHWYYDETKHDKSYLSGKASFAPKGKTTWIKDLLEWQDHASSTEEFLEGLKIDIFKDRIFAFSPKGDVFDLPEGSTPIDFAYSLHTWIGDHLSGAKINGKMVPIGHILENRDIVEIITKKNSPGPKRDWLKYAVTSRAKQKIRSAIN